LSFEAMRDDFMGMEDGEGRVMGREAYGLSNEHGFQYRVLRTEY
jgi:hypothetical protein